ncbi:MAG: hypothetical protein JKY42_04550, partial [Flavobacteriales bacterium]|nr:hypothetical protein [Flavobacteriales bacterium]
MKVIILIVSTFICFYAVGQNIPSNAQETIDINNIRAIINTDGTLFKNSAYGAGFEVPKDSGTHSIYTGSIWFAGMNQTGQLHTAAMWYGTSEDHDYWPGPISNSLDYTSADSVWNRLWKVSAQEINFHIGNYWQSSYSMPEAILNWPAHGDISKGQAANLAPFIDTNNNGIYEPFYGD